MTMRGIALVIVCLSAMCLSACDTMGRATISASADISKYGYATFTDVMTHAGTVPLADIESRICEELTVAGLQMVDGGQVGSLPDEVKLRLLDIRVSGSQGVDGAVIVIVFTDHTTGKTAAICRGTHGKDWTKQREVQAAMNNALSQMRKLF